MYESVNRNNKFDFTKLLEASVLLCVFRYVFFKKIIEPKNIIFLKSRYFLPSSRRNMTFELF